MDATTRSGGQEERGKQAEVNRGVHEALSGAGQPGDCRREEAATRASQGAGLPTSEVADLRLAAQENR